MENRSFEHISGSLVSGRDDIDGLQTPRPTVRTATTTASAASHGAAFERCEDPGHFGEGVAVQLKGFNAGFVKTFIETRSEERRAAAGANDDVLVVSYCGTHTSVYGFLAEQFSVREPLVGQRPRRHVAGPRYASCGQSRAGGQ